MRRALIVILVLLFALPVGGLIAVEQLLAPPGADKTTRVVAIAPGTGVMAVASQLEREKLLRSGLAFALWLRWQGLDRSIKAGSYALAPSMGARGVAKALVGGYSENAAFTVPEGFSLKQIAARLEERQQGSAAQFLALASRRADFQAEFPWLSQLPAGATLEGFLFPDTYVLGPGAGHERDLVRLMLARFGEVALPTYQAERATARLGLFETVTLASIVEKEAIHAEERPLIAGVFFNRLKVRMPFGSDPTVEYALNKHQGERGLSLRDVAVDSPYNTYKHAGLPPGPIANPGAASLKAVLAPDTTPYMYFVARGDGSHVFTHTYAEHLAAQRAIIASKRR